MKIRHIAIASFSVALLTVAAVGLQSAHAVATSTGTSSTAPSVGTTQKIPLDVCAPNAADLNKITTIKNDPALGYSEEIRQELIVRKQLLSQTITCAKNQTIKMQAALNAVSVAGDVSNLQSHLSSKLDDVVNFYNIELTKVDSAGISGTEAIAKEVLAYRSGTYNPLEGQVTNFVIWSENQNLFNTAQSRMDQTSRAVTFLENATPSADLENAFVSARASFTDATTENQAAKDALLQSSPASQSLLLIQQSLSSLSDTYQQFFTVSKIIKKLLP
jgi:hypothetical protein